MPSFSRQQLQELFKERLQAKRAKLSPAVRERRPEVKTPTGWAYPIGVERGYGAYIKALMREFSKIAMPTLQQNLGRWLEEIEDGINSTFLDAYDDEFDDLMGDLRTRQGEIFAEGKEEVEQNVAKFGVQTGQANLKQWNKVSTLAIGEAFDLDSGWVAPTLKNWTSLNYTLISSLSDEYIKKVNTIVAEGVQQGSTYTQIMDQMRKMDNNMTKYRAELIARDQIGKLNGALTEGRMRDAGVEGYIWLTAMDERVRSTHQEMQGSSNIWQDASVYKPRGSAKYKKRKAAMNGATPGSQIQCRCTAIPDFGDMAKDVDELIKQEGESNV